jgi:hypothetical protein
LIEPSRHRALNMTLLIAHSRLLWFEKRTKKASKGRWIESKSANQLRLVYRGRIISLTVARRGFS